MNIDRSEIKKKASNHIEQKQNQKSLFFKLLNFLQIFWQYLSNIWKKRMKNNESYFQNHRYEYSEFDSAENLLLSRNETAQIIRDQFPEIYIPDTLIKKILSEYVKLAEDAYNIEQDVRYSLEESRINKRVAFRKEAAKLIKSYYGYRLCSLKLESQEKLDVWESLSEEAKNLFPSARQWMWRQVSPDPFDDLCKAYIGKEVE